VGANPDRRRDPHLNCTRLEKRANAAQVAA
jgi:hypothetical protein